jgi:dolichol-phosphate mannosyltransferase
MKKLISYILPVYNESDNIDILYKTVDELVASETKYDFELIFINDGSRDNSLDKLVTLQEIDKRVSVINFSRNFGHQIAVTAGLDFALGNAVIIMDSDLQDPPKVSLELINKWQEGYDVVYAQRRTRDDGYFKQLSAKWFYIILQKLADIDIPRNTGDFRLLDRRVVDELKKFPEHDRFLRGLVSYVGFRQTEVLFDRGKRHAGQTGYPMKKMLKFAADGIFSFSTAPLKLISRLGVIISIASFIGIIYASYLKFFVPRITVPGWTLLMISVLLIGGIQLIMLGVIGGYIGRMYTEVKNRPLYIISSVFSSSIHHK